LKLKPTTPQKLGAPAIALISVTGIFSLRVLPLMAEYGLSAIFYYVVIALLFFIPSALICAELAAGWPKTGGLYVWVREAFGDRVGFLAIWLEWTNTVVSFPASLVFIAGIIAYAINPQLATNKYYMVSMMLVMFWGATFINFLGIKFSSWASNISLIFGTLLPCLLIISLGIGWFFADKPLQITFTWHNFAPSFGMAHCAFLAGLVLGFSGMQIAAFHAQEVDNPQRNYPKAIFAATIIILFISILGTLAISIVVPQKNVNVITGLMQATQEFFQAFHMQWFVPIIAVLTAIGMLGMVNVWIIGPCKGLLASARYGDLPPSMRRINKCGAPINLLMMQAIVATIFSLTYLYMPTVSSSFWILIALTTLLALPMNMLIFASVIRLRYSQPEVKRAYKIPGGKFGVWFVAGAAIIVCVITFILGFIPPEQLETGNIIFYEAFLIGGIVVLVSIPFVVPKLKINKRPKIEATKKAPV
jgi:glutamate:GABA antiporter